MRVRSNAESEKIANQNRGGLVKNFKYEPGYTYNIFPTIDSNGDQIIYQENVHSLNFRRSGTGNFDRARCVKGFIDETPDTADKTRPKNTGKCPYCDAAFKAYKMAKQEKEAWEQANPNASKEDKKAAFQKIDDKRPVRMFDTERYYLCAIVEADKTGQNYVIDKDDNLPVVSLRLVKITQSQYDNKLKERINNIVELTGNETMEYTHLRFKYNGKTKMEAAKNLDISIAIKGRDAIFKEFPGLLEKMKNMVGELEKVPEGKKPEDAPINHLDESLFSFVPESEKTIEMHLAKMPSKFRELMTGEEKEELAESIEKQELKSETVEVSDLNKKFNLNTPTDSSQPATANVEASAVSEGGFSPE